MAIPNYLHRLIVRVPHYHADSLAVVLEAHTDSVVWTAEEGQSKAQITCFAEETPDEEAITDAIAAAALSMNFPAPNIEFSIIPTRDWVLENMQQFPPIEIGRFFVHGSEYEGKTPPSKIALCVPAGAAFGTGDHGSTKGCLIALDHLRGKRIRAALDMGCGSGILALAISKRWKCRVAASDIDVNAGHTTEMNASFNGVRNNLDIHVGPGYCNRALKSKSFDLIVSNILARPLIRLSRELALRVAPGGTIILAGLLAMQEPQVVSAHRTQGLHLCRRIRIDGWSTLMFLRRS